MGPEVRNCRACQGQFTIEPDDFSFYERIGVPPPTHCFECRIRRRLVFRNERTFYKRKCDLCAKDIIATYAPDAPNPVYCVKCWWSDGWDPYKYGRDFDFSRTFADQFKELLAVVPAMSMVNDDGISSTNCEYSYDWMYSKDCYMCVCGWHAENCLYTYHSERVKDLMDCVHTRESELAYDCLLSYKLSNCLYCTNCRDSRDCILSEDLQGCSNCFMCFGLRNKSYCIKNKQYSKEEYLEKMSAMNLGSRETVERYKEEFAEFIRGFPRRYASVIRSVNSTGDFIANSKNSKYCFFGSNLENSKYIVVNDGAMDSYDFNMTGKAELAYECVTADNSYANIATVFCFKSKYVEYSQYCPSSEWCFGSTGLKNGSYSIFNKRYSKEEYEKLRAAIIAHMRSTGEWGEFFPHGTSPFAYNETAAQEWFPLSPEEATDKGYGWRQSAAKDYIVTIEAKDLPDTIAEVGDEILSAVISCGHGGTCNEKCSKAFKVIPAELQLYRRFDVPLPRLCPNCRYYGRIKRRNPPRLWARKCMCDNKIYQNSVQHVHEKEPCNNEFETSFAPDRSEILYCEQCYNAEVA